MFICFLGLMIGNGIGCKPPTEMSSGNEKETVEMERVTAEAGVGKQGQIIGDDEGFLLTPAKAFFKTKQRVVFEIQIPHALELYRAEHESLPKSHDEFMEKIVEFNNIKLPELPEGQVYVWDVERGELMVDRPKKKE
jgi:hypothetical protein